MGRCDVSVEVAYFLQSEGHDRGKSDTVGVCAIKTRGSFSTHKAVAAPIYLAIRNNEMDHLGHPGLVMAHGHPS